MAVTVFQLQAYADKLRDARYRGIRSVRDENGEEITFRSDKELEQAIRSVESEISREMHDRLTTAYINTSKGL